MKNTITVATGILTRAVSVASGYLSRDGDFAGKIVVSGDKGFIEIKSTNTIETLVLKKIPFASSDLTKDFFKAFSIDCKKLLTVLKSTKSDEVFIEINTDSIRIKNRKSKVKIETMAKVQEFLHPKCEKDFFIEGNLLAGFQKIVHAIDNDNPKMELNGALIQVKDGVMNLISTDTKRLASVETSSMLADMEIIIPKQSVLSICKLFGDNDKVSGKYGVSSVILDTENISYATKLVNGSFPNWKKIVPSVLEQTIKMNSTVLKELIKEAAIFENDIYLKFVPGKVTIKDYGGNTEIIDEVDTQVDALFGISAKTILDFIDASSSQDIEIGYNAGNIPIVLKSDDDYMEICMPLFLEDAYEAA